MFGCDVPLQWRKWGSTAVVVESLLHDTSLAEGLPGPVSTRGHGLVGGAVPNSTYFKGRRIKRSRPAWQLSKMIFKKKKKDKNRNKEETRETAQLEKCLPHKHKGLSSNPSHSGKG